MVIEITVEDAVWIAHRLTSLSVAVSQKDSTKIREHARRLYGKVCKARKFAKEHPDVSDCPYCGRKANA